jgi:hypothetical protein
LVSEFQEKIPFRYQKELEKEGTSEDACKTAEDEKFKR